jgi:hypothetical protein
MTSVDIVLVLIIAGAFVVGFLWGVIRSLLMLAAWFVVFVLAAILSVPFGDYLSNQWNSYSADWNHMAASGALMAFVGVLGIAGVITILATAHAGLPGTDTVVGPGWTRDMYFQLVHNSQIGSGLSDTLIPALGSILGLLLPRYVREVMV